MSPAPASSKKSAPTYGKPEKANWVVVFTFWLFIVVALGAIIWMVASSPGEKHLTCRQGVATSIIGFGNCTEE